MASGSDGGYAPGRPDFTATFSHCSPRAPVMPGDSADPPPGGLGRTSPASSGLSPSWVRAGSERRASSSVSGGGGGRGLGVLMAPLSPALPQPRTTL